jgi:hypothetical protein
MATIAFVNELKIASGWDATGSYSLITALTDTDSIPYILPKPYINFSVGINKPRLSRRLYQQDSKFFTWYFEGMTVKQLYKLDADYQQTNSAKVTVRTVDFDGTLEDFNAYVIVPRVWQNMFQSPVGVATNTAGNYESNWIADIYIGFNVIAESA